jgi:hypothetical protein
VTDSLPGREDEFPSRNLIPALSRPQFLALEVDLAARTRRSVVVESEPPLLVQGAAGEGSLRCRVRSLVFAAACRAALSRRGVRPDRREIGCEIGGGANCGGRSRMLGEVRSRHVK